MRHLNRCLHSQASLPRFVVNAASVRPLRSPQEFYNTLLDGCLKAHHRVTLASLYLGTGHLECDLVEALLHRCRETHASNSKQLEIATQLDLNRGLRKVAPNTGAPPSLQHTSSSQLLLELLRGAPDPSRIHCGLTLMPQQRGMLGRLLPQRIVEVLGVFHLKAYVFDSNVLISGANLSSDYFTTRQDRYVLLEDVPALATYLHALIDGIRAIPGAHVLLPTGDVGHYTVSGAVEVMRDSGHSVSVPVMKSVPYSARRLDSSSLPPVTYTPLRDASLNACFSSGLGTLLQRFSSSTDIEADVNTTSHASQTIVTPRLQCGAVGICVDESETLRLLCSLGPALVPRMSLAKGALDDSESASAVQELVMRNPGSDRHRDVCFIASGYFNFPGRFRRALLPRCDIPQVIPIDLSVLQKGFSVLADVAECIRNKVVRFAESGDSLERASTAHALSSIHILTAAPEANGFFGARGISGAIPNVYGETLRRFYIAALRSGRLMAVAKCIAAENGEAGTDLHVACGPGVALYEYARSGWTFHGKGLWLLREEYTGGTTDSRGELRLITLFGSPNFGRRSVNRDFELQFELATRESALVKQFSDECDALFGAVDISSCAVKSPRHPITISDTSAVRAPSMLSHASSDGQLALLRQSQLTLNSSTNVAAHTIPAMRCGVQSLNAPVHVAAIGPHFGPHSNVWLHPGRKLTGWSWTSGSWIHLGSRILAPFF